MNEQKEGWEKSFEQRIRNIFTLLIADAKDRHRNTYHIWAKDPDEAFEIIKKEIKFLLSKDRDTLIEKIEKEIEQSNFEGVNGEYQGGKLQAFDKVKQIILETLKE